MTDSEIIELYQKRDEGAIRQTQDKYQRYLMKTAMQILNNEQDAEECVNDTYLAAWESIPGTRPEHLSLYLAKIARAKAIDRVRYQTSTKRSSNEYDLSLEELDEVVSPGTSPEEELDLALLRNAIGAFLLKQPVNVRKLFLARYFSFQSLKEAAFSCGMSESKAKTVLFRLRKKLRSYLKKEGFTV